MTDTHELYSALHSLKLYPMVCGSGQFENIKASCEPKHVSKCVRRRGKSPTGCKIADKTLTGLKLRVLMTVIY